MDELVPYLATGETGMLSVPGWRKMLGAGKVRDIEFMFPLIDDFTVVLPKAADYELLSENVPPDILLRLKFAAGNIINDLLRCCHATQNTPVFVEYARVLCAVLDKFVIT